jgi:mono/diheme cytochrome c family protein
MKKTRNYFLAGTCFAALALLSACGGNDNANNATLDNSDTKVNTPNETVVPEDNGKGVGPVKDVEIKAWIDKDLAEKGEELFETKCTACHEISDKRKVGPGLLGVTDRRKPEWIMNMILNPENMIKEDPTAKKLYEEILTPMANQGLTQDEAREVLEYLRQQNQTKPS